MGSTQPVAKTAVAAAMARNLRIPNHTVRGKDPTIPVAYLSPSKVLRELLDMCHDPSNDVLDVEMRIVQLLELEDAGGVLDLDDIDL